jgi:hypothetical protein
MNEIYRIPDTYRQSTELEAARIDEAKEKLVRDSENKLLTRFFTLYGNGKIASATETTLTQVAGASTSDIVFDGSITVNANVGNKTISISLPVKANTVELIDDTELKSLVDSAEIKTTADETIDLVQAFPVQADLSQFLLHDDGSDYLKVYHPALDSGRELGVISKAEYESLKDKEAFFKETLENQIKNSILENHYELSYAGSFSEPSIQSIQVESIITAADFNKETVTKTAALEEPVEAVEEGNLFLGHQADSYRQAEEFESQKTQAEIDRLSTKLANEVVAHLRNLRYNDVKVLSVDNSDAASFKVTASLIDEVGEKVVTFSVPVRDFSYSLPKKEVIAKLVSETADLQSKIAESITQETLDRIQDIDEAELWKENETTAAFEEEKITKTAGEVGGVQFIGPVDVLNIDKHTLASYGIPEDMEIGEKVYADGFHWQLTSKDQNNLSKEANSGSVWTFTKVAPTEKQPEHEVKA